MTGISAGKKAAVLFAIVAIAATATWFATRPRNTPAPPHRATPTPARLEAKTFATDHYTVETRATDAQTRQVAAAAESLRAAYLLQFPEAAARVRGAKHQLVLYRDRDDFKAHNRSRPWAEAYYLEPACHAYIGEGEPNPTHWMVHEATHQ